MRLTLAAIILAFLTLNACSNSSTTKEEKQPEKEQVKEDDNPKKYTLTPFSPSQSYPDAKIESMSYKGGTFKFGVADGSYKLGVQTPDAPQKNCANSGKGQHIHLIVDNKPYAAKYVSEFEHEVADGKHYVLAFLSRSYHESIKTPGASVVKKIEVADKTIKNESEIEQPMLFYSRPKGTYVGKDNTNKVMLDFYLANATLGADYTVQAEINGEKHMIDKWQPYYIEGLPMGKNTVRLTLLEKDGQMARVPLNPVIREFELKEDPLEEG